MLLLMLIMLDINEDTNKKSLFPATKTLHNGAQRVEQPKSSEDAKGDVAWANDANNVGYQHGRNMPVEILIYT